MHEARVVCVSIHYAEQCFRYGACMRHVWCVSPFIMLNSASGMVHDEACVVCVSIHYAEQCHMVLHGACMAGTCGVCLHSLCWTVLQVVHV